jgi:hypothetical protein
MVDPPLDRNDLYKDTGKHRQTAIQIDVDHQYDLMMAYQTMITAMTMT